MELRTLPDLKLHFHFIMFTNACQQFIWFFIISVRSMTFFDIMGNKKRQCVWHCLFF